MKIIRKNQKYKNKLIELQIIKSKIYKNFIEKKIENNKIKLHFKKVAHIIYEYHIKNKTILFVNFPTEFKSNLTSIKKTLKHVFISKENWANKIFTNKSLNTYSQVLSQQQHIQNVKLNFSKNKQFFDLLVLFNVTNTNLLTETFNSSIPTILITDEIFINKRGILNQSYKIFGSFNFIEEQINNNFFFSILHNILKQSIFFKKKSQQYNSRLIIKKKIKKYFNNSRYKNYFY